MEEIEIMYPQIIIYTVIAVGVLLLVWRKREKFKKGVVVANTKYIKKTTYYKSLIIRYRLYMLLIKSLCVIIIIVATVLTARLYKINKHEEDVYNRDIMICMDVSGSVFNLDAEIIGTFIDIVGRLKDERFGISAFDSSPVTILPLTNDYNYAIAFLKELQGAFYTKLSDNTYARNASTLRSPFLGAFSGIGSSLIGDGLAYCVSTFKKDDDRTKIVIFTTDNELDGNQIISVSQAAYYAKKNNVKIYPIGTKTIKSENRQELVDVANISGGVYYDYKDFSTDDIAAKIEELNKTAITKNISVTIHDLPEIVFPYLLCLIPILFILDWRVRI